MDHHQPPFAGSSLIQVYLSVDDLYLPFDEQSKLALTHSENPLLRYRGNAGTHSVDLGTKTLEALCAAHKSFEARKGRGETDFGGRKDPTQLGRKGK